MKNTKENTDLNMGRAKNDRWKKILGIILNIGFFLYFTRVKKEIVSEE